MRMWLLIVSLVLIVFSLGVCYLTMAVGRFGGVQRLAGGKKWRRRLISLGIVTVVFIAAVLIFNLVNAVLILLHMAVAFLLTGFAMKVIARVRGRETVIYWQGWTALLLCAVYLSVAYYLCTNVWQTEYQLTTSKPVGTLRIAMFADSHIGSTFDGEELSVYAARIMAQNPDIVMIPGDYVDDGTDREDMVAACEALGEMHPRYGVWFAFGNHDKGFYGDEARGYSADDLIAELEKNGVHVLMDEAENVGETLCVVGRKDRYVDSDRKSMSELLENADRNRYIVVMDHEPNDYEHEVGSGADLVLSGHTHGGQLLPVNYVGEWFGVNDKTYGYEKIDGTDFIVTSGIADWEMLFKTGTKSEYVIVDIKSQ